MHTQKHNEFVFNHKEEQNYVVFREMTVNENYHTNKLSQSLKGKPAFSHLWVLDSYRHISSHMCT